MTTQKKNLEIESVGVAGKCDSDQAVKKYFRLEVGNISGKRASTAT